MLKYFTVITGLATLIGTLKLFLKGPGFYISLALSLSFALATLFALYQNDRAKHLKVIVDLLMTDLLRDVGKEEAYLIADTAKNPGMQNEMSDVLASVLNVKRDPTERFWIYIALGEIGGRKCRSVVKKALSNEKGYALSGVKQAWELMTENQKKKGKT